MTSIARTAPLQSHSCHHRDGAEAAPPQGPLPHSKDREQGLGEAPGQPVLSGYPPAPPPWGSLAAAAPTLRGTALIQHQETSQMSCLFGFRFSYHRTMS